MVLLLAGRQGCSARAGLHRGRLAELLDLGDGGVGYLNAAIGVGAFLGAVGALTLTATRRLRPAFLAGSRRDRIPLVAIGLWQEVLVALVAFAVIGVGNSYVDVAGLTLCNVPFRTRSWREYFGVIQMLFLASMGIGRRRAGTHRVARRRERDHRDGLALPVLVAVLGVTVGADRRQRVGAEHDELRVLASVPIFAPLPGGSLEHLAARLVPLRVDPGTVIVREGDAGDRFYIVADGELEVSQYGRKISELDCRRVLGEIALLETSRERRR